MRFVLLLLTFRHLISRAGIIHLSEVVKESGGAPTIGIIDELLDAGVMGQRDDDIYDIGKVDGMKLSTSGPRKEGVRNARLILAV